MYLPRLEIKIKSKSGFRQRDVPKSCQIAVNHSKSCGSSGLNSGFDSNLTY